MIHEDRWVATYSIARKVPNSSSEVPRSLVMTSRPIAMTQPTTIGMKSRARGRSRILNRPTLIDLAASDRTWRLVTRYEDRKITRAIFANSDGCMVKPPKPIHRRAPYSLMPSPGTIGSAIRTIATRALM